MGVYQAATSKASRVIFDGGDKRRSPYFGAGVLRSLPSHRLDCTLADLAEAATIFAEPLWEDDEILEARFAEYEAVDKLCRGISCR